jgi:hypothetical protein
MHGLEDVVSLAAPADWRVLEYVVGRPGARIILKTEVSDRSPSRV